MLTRPLSHTLPRPLLLQVSDGDSSELTSSVQGVVLMLLSHLRQTLTTPTGTHEGTVPFCVAIYPFWMLPLRAYNVCLECQMSVALDKASLMMCLD